MRTSLGAPFYMMERLRGGCSAIALAGCAEERRASIWKWPAHGAITFCSGPLMWSGRIRSPGNYFERRITNAGNVSMKNRTHGIEALGIDWSQAGPAICRPTMALFAIARWRLPFGAHLIVSTRKRAENYRRSALGSCSNLGHAAGQIWGFASPMAQRARNGDMAGFLGNRRGSKAAFHTGGVRREYMRATAS